MAVGKLIAVLVLLQCSTGLMGAAVGSSIIGGDEAPEGKWPGLAYLHIVSKDRSKEWHCSGTILNEKWVLTAARCLDKDNQTTPRLDRSGVWIGTHDVDLPSQSYMEIDRIQMSGDYKHEGEIYLNDIALVMLKENIKFSPEVAKVKLPTADDTFDASSECWIAGWGDDGKGEPDPARVLQQAKITILPQEKCKGYLLDKTDQSKVLCAGDAKGKKSACDGDYGDPLMCRKGNDFVQVGIMSLGTAIGCNKPDGPSVYTRVSSYLKFIDDYTHFRP